MVRRVISAEGAYIAQGEHLGRPPMKFHGKKVPVTFLNQEKAAIDGKHFRSNPLAPFELIRMFKERRTNRHAPARVNLFLLESQARQDKRILDALIAAEKDGCNYVTFRDGQFIAEKHDFTKGGTDFWDHKHSDWMRISEIISRVKPAFTSGEQVEHINTANRTKTREIVEKQKDGTYKIKKIGNNPIRKYNKTNKGVRLWGDSIIVHSANEAVPPAGATINAVTGTKYTPMSERRILRNEIRTIQSRALPEKKVAIGTEPAPKLSVVKIIMDEPQRNGKPDIVEIIVPDKLKNEILAMWNRDARHYHP